MDLKKLLAPSISNDEFTARYNVLHRQVYAAPPFDFDSTTSKVYTAPEGYYVVDHCIVHDGDNWHFYYVTGEHKNYEKWAEAYYNKVTDPEVFKKYQYEIGDGHAVGKTMEDLHFKNIILTKPQGNFDIHTRGNTHIVKYKDHWVALYQVRGPEGHKICTARSKDLYEWVPDAKNPSFGPPEWAYQGGQCKDVHITPWKGVFLVYYLVEGQDSMQTVAMKVTEDFEHYVEIGPVFKGPNMARGTRGMETPTVFERNGLWHLFYGWGIYGVWHAVSNRPDTFVGSDMSGWSGSQDRLQHGTYAVGCYHAIEIIEHEGEWFLTTTKREELRRTDMENRVLKFRSSVEDEHRITHGLFKSKIVWDGDYPTFMKP